MKKVLLLITFSFSFVGILAQTEVEKATATITQDEIKGHIYFLADDLLEGRATGTPGNKIAASYLANTLRSYGAKPNPLTGKFYQEVPLKRSKIPEMSFFINGSPVNRVVTVSTAELDYNAELVYLNYGLEEDYIGKDLHGKLILLRAGTPTVSDPISAYQLIEKKKEMARQAGALGVVEIIKVEENVWEQIEQEVNIEKLSLIGGPEDNDFAVFPYLWIKESKLERKNYFDSPVPLNANFKIEKPESDTIISQNVIGIIDGTDPQLKNEYVMFTAHYDHLGIGAPDASGDTIYNGARDNAVGTSTVLSMADNLSKYPTKRSALFVFFTGEEPGLFGSLFYSKNPLIPLEQVVYVFNSDNGGYNDTSIATVVGLERTTAAPHIKKAATAFGITAIDVPVSEEDLFYQSDNAPFAKLGIPAPTFSLGFRSFDGDVTKYYHQAGDEADNLDYNYLLKFFRTYILAGRLIANEPTPPFWTPGDKYEEVGKNHYSKH